MAEDSDVCVDVLSASNIFYFNMGGITWARGNYLAVFSIEHWIHYPRNDIFDNPLCILKGILRSTITLTANVVEYFKPAALYGVVALILRFANLIFPGLYTIRGVIEQGSLLIALIISYYRLGVILSHNSPKRKYLVRITSAISGITACLLFPPPL
ncbi:hypothetical protein [Palaeococcus ferrophilus]|uniref:hypothetical protein n=1 Tax=Palaeococcus ferrophilus TaxID=83868 RepID=UPI00064FF7C0|nr:hypothetical protein [Palaeococcus ferrophilus]